MESCGEILNFNARIGNFSGIILHEDILVEDNMSMSESPLNEKSQLDLLCIAEAFFSRIHQQQISEMDAEQSKLCHKNHLYLSVSPISAEGIQQRNKNILAMKTSIAATKCDFWEVLNERALPLICFDRSENCPDGYHKRPEVILGLKSTFSCKSKDVATVTFDITLEKCTLELDVSIYDRLSCILGPSPYAICFTYCATEYNANGNQHQEASTKPSTTVNIMSRTLDVKLRFPIVDARAIHDPARIPWWMQNIRPDFLLLTFYQLNIKSDPGTTIEIKANEINAFYCEKTVDSRIHLLKTCLAKQEKHQSIEETFEYPSITINFRDAKKLTNFFGANKNKETSQTNLPFSAKRVCRQSDTVHNKCDIGDSEAILLPGETEELNEFCDSTMKTSKLQIRINLPIVDILIESKQLYETIYNRLNTDLFMWEPTSPILKETGYNYSSQMCQSVINVGMMDSMYVPSILPQDPYESMDEKLSSVDENWKKCSKENKEFLNLSESEEIHANINNMNSFSGVGMSESIYFSAHEANQKSKAKMKHEMKSSDCAVEITIGKGSLALFVPVRDTNNHVLPEQLGKFDLRTEKLRIFSVTGYNDNKNLAYVCLRLDNVEVYHCGIVPVDFSTKLKVFDTSIADYMQSTFYKVPNGLTKGEYPGNDKREMLSLVIEIKKIPTQRIKRLRITTGIQRMALHHNPVISSHTWLNQLIDFLDVVDYPIEGYSPYGAISEVQLHIWDSAIDYRPKNFAYRAVMEIGSFTMSSNIISSVTGCNLRFVVEECILSLAPHNNQNDNCPPSKVTFINSNNLVPVLEIGLFDISLRLSEIVAEKHPKFDLRCSIHDAHLRTCSDSGSALAQLISYIANDGDISNCTIDENSSSFGSSMHSDAEILTAKDAKSPPDPLTEKQQERVNIMMADALNEIITSTDPSSMEYAQSILNINQGIEVFYFPDESKRTLSHSYQEEATNGNELSDILNFESNVMLSSYYIKSDNDDPLPQVKADLGDIKNRTERSKENTMQEEDYCIIADEEKLFMNHCGIKNVNVSEDPLRIVDNHFCLPTAKPDLLKSPENFPMAVLRYTLCEMTFTWHLYGGKDFPDIPSSDNGNMQKENPRMSEIYKHGVSYSKGTQGVQFGKKPKEKLTWKTIGGAQRNHEVLVEMQFSKIRFSHEVYPTSTFHGSRQVLLIGEIEIRDRLQSSDINKFLYHPNLNNLSNKSPQHMVVIKALHIRPNPQKSPAQECSLRISLLPLRLHIDQDTLLFLTEYFTSLGDNCNTENYANSKTTTAQKTDAPVMTVDEVPESIQDLRTRKLVATNLDLLIDEEKNTEPDNSSSPLPTSDKSEPIFFREVIFSPEVPICFDYHGRHVEMSRGPVTGLLMGLGQLQCSEIRLRKVIYRRGFLGVEKLLTYLCKEWLKDIKKNQLQKILSGVGPTYAFVQLFQGICDLFRLPIEQYQKDGRIIRGLQLGAQSFTARTALAALEITSRVIQLLQFTAETAFDMVSPGPSVRSTRKTQKGKKKRPLRPKDIREGVTNAYLIVKEGINDSANVLIETAVAEHDQKGYTGAVGAVMRQIPQLVVCPAVLATQATTNILGGVKNSLVPDAKREACEKWKDDSV